MPRLIFISDTHNKHRKLEIPGCDILLHVGDFSALGRHNETEQFLKWFSKQPAKHLVYIAGNHDISYQREPVFKRKMLAKYSKCIYLEDSGIILEGLEIWGSPWSPDFYPERWVFNLPRGSDALNNKWQQIPRSTDILLTHSPLAGILDRCQNWHPHYPQNAGCELLRHRVEEIGTIKICAVGHVHEGRGMDYRTLAPTTVINVSTCNLQYQPVNPPVIIDF